MLAEILKNFALFVDDRGYAGNVEEVTPPKLTVKTEEFRNGGMDAPVAVDMGMEKLECSFSLTKFDRDVLKLWGLAQGAQTKLTMRGAVDSSGTVSPVVIHLVGQLTEVDFGSWKPGDKAVLKVTVALTYYKLVHGAEVVHEIDVPGMKRVIGGVDQLSAIRSAIGM